MFLLQMTYYTEVYSYKQNYRKMPWLVWLNALFPFPLLIFPLILLDKEAVQGKEN